MIERIEIVVCISILNIKEETRTKRRVWDRSKSNDYLGEDNKNDTDIKYYRRIISDVIRPTEKEGLFVRLQSYLGNIYMKSEKRLNDILFV